MTEPHADGGTMAAEARTIRRQPCRRRATRGVPVLGVLRPAALAVLGCLAALGALTRPTAFLALGAAAAGLTWALVRHLHGDGAPGLPGLPHPAVPATGALVASAAVTGTAALGAPAVGIVGALAAAPLAVTRWSAG